MYYLESKFRLLHTVFVIDFLIFNAYFPLMPAPKPFLLLITLVMCLEISAQLPDCTSYHYAYFHTGSGIHNVNFDDPSQSFSNSISLPTGAEGLVVSRNLNASSPSTTFYTVVNKRYYYHDGNGWVNTNHYAGEGLNSGGGGGFIYNLGPAGTVYRYDGTGDAQYLVTTGIAGVADIAVDQCGNFYILKNSAPQALRKYNSDGVLIESFVLLGAPVFTGGGGLVVSGNNVYYDDMSVPGQSAILHGVISGGAVDFLPSGISLMDVRDAASCPSPSTRVDVTTATVCSNDLPYEWNGHAYSLPGTYTISTTGTTGCDSVAILELTINTASTTTTLDSGVCLTALPFNWNGISINAAGTYTANLAGSSGCDSVVTLNLTASPVPDPPAVNAFLQYCRFENAPQLTATAPGNLVWYESASGGAGSATPPKPSTQDAGTFTYYVSTSNNGCESFRSAINVNVLPTPLLGEDRAARICFGTSANLFDYVAGNTGGTWTTTQGLVADPSAVTASDTYRYVSINSFGCSDTLYIHLGIQPELIANAGADDSIMIGFSYQLQGSGGMQYQWWPGAPVVDNPQVANPKATIAADTEFILTVGDEIGCTDQDTVFIKAYEGTEIWLPTAFTPDGDGRNDIFRILTSAIKRLDHFRIFNRFGELLFETRDPFRGWDGTFKGQQQETGTYIWNLQALDNQGRLRNMKGAFTLIR